MEEQLTDAQRYQLGVLKPAELKDMAEQKIPYLIENLFLKPSINILAGHSGLGKSALCVQIGMCVASGKDFLNYKVTDPGVVIFCDQESTPAMMGPMGVAVSQALQLGDVPDNFQTWNPHWKIDNRPIVGNLKVRLYEIVRKMKPKLVILDTLRAFYPMAIKEGDQAAAMIKEMRKLSGDVGVSWLIVHHLRKGDREERANNTRPTIQRDTLQWFEEATGSLALINNTDTRLGWEEDRGHKLWLGGFLRVSGILGPYKMERVLDNTGDPLGYRMAGPIDQLTRDMTTTYESLPANGCFDFYFLTTGMGKSRSSASRFIRRAVELGAIVLDHEEAPSTGGKPLKQYRKIHFTVDGELIDTETGEVEE